MSVSETFEEMIKELETTRDEIKLQAHLLKMETQDDWDAMEKKWGELSTTLKSVNSTGQEAASNIGAAAELLANEIKSGYEKIKSKL